MDDRLEIECIGVLAGASEVRTKVLSGIALGRESVEEAAYLVKCRVKDQQSLMLKVKDRRADGNPDYSATDVRDIVGLRLLTLFRKDLPRLVKRFMNFVDAGLSDEFSIFSGFDLRDAVEEIIIYTARPDDDEIERRLVDLFQSRGLDISYSEQDDPDNGLFVKVRRKKSLYSSIHFVIWCENVVSGQLKHKIPMEVQIRTSLEDVWGEIEHKLGYKNEDLGDDNSSRSHIDTAKGHLKILKGHLESCTDSADLIRQQMEYATPTKMRFTASVSAPSVNTGTLVKLPIGEPRLERVRQISADLENAFVEFSSDKPDRPEAHFLALGTRFNKAAEGLAELASEVEVETSLNVEEMKTSLYYLNMEAALAYYWAGRVASSIKSDPGSAQRADEFFGKALRIYDKLTRDRSYNHDAILAYRVANVLTAQGQNELALGKLQEAVYELEKFQQPNLSDDHFLRVRIPRQLGVAYWEMAERHKVHASEVGVGDMFEAKRQGLYLDALAVTLPLINAEVSKSSASFMGAEESADEELKTINNIIEFSSCFLRSGGSWSLLDKMSVTQDKLNELIHRLVQEAPQDKLQIPVWGDTLRAAHEELLGDLPTAKAYAQQTIELLRGNSSGFVALHGQRVVDEMIEDAEQTLAKK